jgi:hypothetical protein
MRPFCAIVQLDKYFAVSVERFRPFYACRVFDGLIHKPLALSG